MRKKKALALILSASMVFTTQFTSFAAETTVSVNETTAENEVSVNAAAEEEPSVELAEVKSDVEAEIESLSTLEAGVDYVEDEAFFYADSQEEAEKVAASYDAELESFVEGIGILKFEGENVETAMESSLSSQSANTRVYVNYISEVDGTEAEYVDNFESSLFDESLLSVSRNDPAYSKQWHHSYINDTEAWDTATGKGVKVAVIDTGIDVDHEDLADKLAGQYDAITGSTSKNSVEDEVGHGTHVSGIIAADADNKLGGCGVAPDASIYMLKVTNARGVELANIFRALEYLTSGEGKKWNVDVVNISIGGYALSSKVKEQYQKYMDNLAKDGVTVVASAGNDSTSYPAYPASLDNVISVASTDSDGTLSYFSNYGSTVDVAAPGGEIYSTYMKGQYASLSGTSMASPVVAGVAALVYQSKGLAGSNSSSASTAVSSKVINSTDGRTYTYGSHSVTGCIDAAAAVNNFYIKANTGMITSAGGIIPVAIGKTLKFTVCDENGNKIKGIKKKDVEWGISTSVNTVTMKNGKLKVNKKTAENTSLVLTASYNGKSLKIGGVTIPATKYFGYISGRKFVKSYNKTVSLNSPVDLSSLSKLTGTNIYMCYKRQKQGTIMTYYPTGTADSLGFITTTNKKTLKNSSVVYNTYGSITEFTPTKAGKYKFKCKALDGSGKSFTVTLTAK
ncbi:MAG: S8 family serine peptidase [Lachnospiraceae bacterium]|nr:S8 family serine peptidase [Lachnospiraceae bacterium]